MWDLPGAGLEPVSPALAGGFLTTVPPGKSLFLRLLFVFIKSVPNLYYFMHLKALSPQAFYLTIKEVRGAKKLKS